MRLKQANYASLSSVRTWTALLCLLLVGITCAVQALHSHAGDPAGDAKHCTACQVAHTPARVASIAHFLVPLTTTLVVGFSASPRIKSGLDSSPLFCRPPPAHLL